MKKLLVILLLILCACSNNSNKPSYPYEVKTEKVDMSAYDGVSSTQHNFMKTKVSELFKCFEEKSSGIFYIGRTNCNCCQTVTKYVSQKASDLGVTVYYIDAFDPEEPLTEKETYNKLVEYLSDYLPEDENGKKSLLTPHLFTLINGNIVGSQICHDGIEFNKPETEQQVKNLLDIYQTIMEPFVP